MGAKCELTAFGEDLEGANPAAEVGIGSMNVGGKPKPELDLHLGNVLELEAREIGPGLVGVSVVIKELVGKHEGSDKESELAAVLTTKTGILGLESVNVEKGEDDDRLGDLCGVEHVADKVGEAATREETEGARVVGSFTGAGSGAIGIDSGTSVGLDGVVQVPYREGDSFRQAAEAELLGVTLCGGRTGDREAARTRRGAGGDGERVGGLVAVDAAEPDIADHLGTPVADRCGRLEFSIVDECLGGSCSGCGFHLDV